MPAPQYKRILLKLSGEVLMGEQEYGIDPAYVARLAEEVKAAKDTGLEICLVIGGGNIFRGVAGAARGLDRTTGDYMGMLATVMNALAMQNALEQAGVPTRVQSAIPMSSVCEPYIRRRAERHLEKGRIVIFAAGTGNPFFTTDTGAALRAAEMNCDALLKGTSVDGVYDSDPKSNPDAKRFDTISYDRVLADNLKVMDATAVALARENDIPIMVFSIRERGNLARVLAGEGTQTIVTAELPSKFDHQKVQKTKNRKKPLFEIMATGDIQVSNSNDKRDTTKDPATGRFVKKSKSGSNSTAKAKK